MIDTSYCARIFNHQINNNDDRHHQLTQKYSTMDLACNALQGNIVVCANQIDGSGDIYYEFNPYAPSCNYFDFHGNVVNISNSNDACHSYHYSGNLTAKVTTNHEYNSNIITGDNIIVNDIPAGAYNYTLNADINLCLVDLYVNLTLCNNDSCVVYDPVGICALTGGNSTCTSYTFAVIIHSMNKTNMFI